MAMPAITFFISGKEGMKDPDKIKDHIQEIKKKLEQTPENPQRPPKKSEEKLVTIEFQKEYDVFKSSWEERVFVKLYVEARSSGLLKAISDRDWKTLCTLATFMNKDGKCYPSQNELARALGVSRQMANERIQSLLKFRFKDQPVLILEKARRKTESGERWDNNHYTIKPISNLKIFDYGIPKYLKKPNNKDPMSRKLDIGLCQENPVSGKLDTNKNHILNKILNNVNNADKKISKKRSDEQEYLAQDLAERLDDDRSLGFYRRIVELLPKHVIYQTLSEVKDAYLTGRVKRSKGALFNSIIQAKAEEFGIELNLKRDTE